MTCTVAGHLVTTADVDAAQVVNTATATGHGPAGNILHSPPAKATVPVDPEPSPPLAATGVTNASEFVGWGAGLVILGGLLLLVAGISRRRSS
jgi:hypothetical protein